MTDTKSEEKDRLIVPSTSTTTRDEMGGKRKSRMLLRISSQMKNIESDRSETNSSSTKAAAAPPQKFTTCSRRLEKVRQNLNSKRLHKFYWNIPDTKDIKSEMNTLSPSSSSLATAATVRNSELSLSPSHSSSSSNFNLTPPNTLIVFDESDCHSSHESSKEEYSKVIGEDKIWKPPTLARLTTTLNNSNQDKLFSKECSYIQFNAEKNSCWKNIASLNIKVKEDVDKTVVIELNPNKIPTEPIMTEKSKSTWNDGIEKNNVVSEDPSLQLINASQIEHVSGDCQSIEPEKSSMKELLPLLRENREEIFKA